MFPHLCLYAGDFNCGHVDWGYYDNNPDDVCFAGWASTNCLALLHNPKDAASFCSGRWNTGTYPNLAFVSVSPYTYGLDVCLKSLPGHNIDHRLSHYQGLLCQCQACLLSDLTSARSNEITI